jgi:hypothetical protein
MNIFCLCMICIKFTARPQTLIVSPKFASMASNGTPEVSTKLREASTERPEESLVGQQMIASTETASEQDVKSDRES